MKNDTVLSVVTQDRKLSDALVFKGEVYEYYDCGNTRAVYVNKDKTKVVKVELKEGKGYNREEWEIYVASPDKTRLAYTELCPQTGYVIQEFAEPIKFGDKKLTIKDAYFAASCRGEVGITNDGRLVCFDLDEYLKY